MALFGNTGDLASVAKPAEKYLVVQVTLKEALIGTGSNTATLSQLQSVLNEYADKGYRLHTIATSESSSKGLLGGDRIQATIVFEKID